MGTFVFIMLRIGLLLCFIAFLLSCDDTEDAGTFTLTRIFVGTSEIDPGGSATGLPVDRSITLIFSSPVDEQTAESAITLKNQSGSIVNVEISFTSQATSVVLFPAGSLEANTIYTIDISNELKGQGGQSFPGQAISFKTAAAALRITAVEINETNIEADRIPEVPLNLGITIHFSAPLDVSSFSSAIDFSGTGLQFSFFNDNKSVLLTTSTQLKHLWRYTLSLSNTLKGAGGEPFQTVTKTLYTTSSDTPQFPLITDEELLTLVQEQTFKYFWDFAHPASGMARERNTSGDLVTSGGSGFGIMALIVGMHRNFITRDQGLERMEKILAFLETADRFHGAWPHWLDGNTGAVIPFSANDNGGDLVETSFLIQGLIAFRQYMNPGDAREQVIIQRINDLWETVEWDWYTKGGEDVLYWHWSPDKGWVMNHQIRGHNETLITYFLAAASPTHPIDASVYHKGYARDGAIANGKSFYGITLPLGEDLGGPLFFSHYSFLGLDPRNLADTYANYWTQNVNHSKINHAYVVDNPKEYIGYSESSWGLTASDNPQGYSAHSPTNDLGVITPTAALSSFPYTPEESMAAMKFFYYTIGDRLWGPYGFYDAYDLTKGWTASSYLAIDQGPIIIMIENYRSGLIWNLFMDAPEVQTAAAKLGFTY